MAVQVTESWALLAPSRSCGALAALKQWAYISCGTCVRNRINLSRGNYKEPYIRKPATSVALADLRNAEQRRERKLSRGWERQKGGLLQREEDREQGQVCRKKKASVEGW